MSEAVVSLAGGSEKNCEIERYDSVVCLTAHHTLRYASRNRPISGSFSAA